MLPECDFEDLVADFDHVRFEAGHEELRTWAVMAGGRVDVGPTEGSDLLGNALAVKRVKGAVELIQDVERKGLDALDGEDEAGSHDGFLASREVRQGQRMHLSFVGLVLLRGDHLLLVLGLSLGIGEADEHSDAFVEGVSDGELILLDAREL